MRSSRAEPSSSNPRPWRWAAVPGAILLVAHDALLHLGIPRQGRGQIQRTARRILLQPVRHGTLGAHRLAGLLPAQNQLVMAPCTHALPHGCAAGMRISAPLDKQKTGEKSSASTGTMPP